MREAKSLLNEVVKSVQSDRSARNRDENTGSSANDGANDESGTADNHQRDVLTCMQARFSYR